MDDAKSNELLEEAKQQLDVLKSIADVVNYEDRIYDVQCTLEKALKHNPNNLAALEMKVLVRADETGAYAEAFEDADRLAKLAPENQSYQELRERIRVRAKQYWSEIPDE